LPWTVYGPAVISDRCAGGRGVRPGTEGPEAEVQGLVKPANYRRTSEPFRGAAGYTRYLGGAMLKIVFKDGETKKYLPTEYTEFQYDGKAFIVIRKSKWIGIYNFDCILSVECTD
jgi:hypothetical protein